MEGYRKGLYADFMMREEMSRVQGERATAEERRNELQLQLSHLDRALTYQRQVQEFAGHMGQGLDQMNFAERRALLRLLADEVVYDDGKVTIKTIIPLSRLHPVHQWLRRGQEQSYQKLARERSEGSSSAQHMAIVTSSASARGYCSLI